MLTIVYSIIFFFLQRRFSIIYNFECDRFEFLLKWILMTLFGELPRDKIEMKKCQASLAGLHGIDCNDLDDEINMLLIIYLIVRTRMLGSTLKLSALQRSNVYKSIFNFVNPLRIIHKK